VSVQLANSKGYNEVQAPVLRKIIQSGDSFTPTADTLVMLGSDVTITIGDKSIDILKSMSLILKKGVQYDFSDDTALGVA